MSRTIVPLSEHVDPRVVGGKAANLAQLIRMGLRVPDCVCVVTTTQEAAGAATVDLTSWVPQHLPSRSGWAVRSSAPCEDGVETSYAGRFETLTVLDPSELDVAVQRVCESGARARLAPHEMAVVVQKFVEPEAAGAVMSADPLSGVPGAIVEYVRGRGERLVSGAATPYTYRRGVEPATDSPLSAALLREICSTAESTAASVGYPADMEWASADGVIYWLQLRPMTGLAQQRGFAVPRELASSLRGSWSLMEHCYLPVAPLIRELDPGGYFAGPNWKSQVVGGYHFISLNDAEGAAAPSADAREIIASWAELEAALGPKLDEMLAAPLDRFRDLELWNELHARAECNRELFRRYLDTRFFRVRREAVADLRSLLESAPLPTGSIGAALVSLLSGLGTRTSRKQHLVRELAALLRQHPDIAEADHRVRADAGAARAWDLRWSSLMDEFGFEAPNTELYYLPTLRETPELLLQSIRALAASPAEPSSAPAWTESAARVRSLIEAVHRDAFDRQLTLARECLRRTEDDDYLMQKASAAVRYALLEAGRRGVEAGALARSFDVFFLTLEELRSALSKGSWPRSREEIRHRRAAFDQAKNTAPPSLIIDGQPVFGSPAHEGRVLKGQVASSGRASGAAFVLANPLHPPAAMPAGSVIVTTMLTPALAYALTGCSAIITEVGGLASHGAIVARELGIPAVVGVAGVATSIRSGTHITVDGSRGEIYVQS